MDEGIIRDALARIRSDIDDIQNLIEVPWDDLSKGEQAAFLRQRDETPTSMGPEMVTPEEYHHWKVGDGYNGWGSWDEVHDIAGALVGKASEFERTLRAFLDTFLGEYSGTLIEDVPDETMEGLGRLTTLYLNQSRSSHFHLKNGGARALSIKRRAEKYCSCPLTYKARTEGVTSQAPSKGCGTCGKPFFHPGYDGAEEE